MIYKEKADYLSKLRVNGFFSMEICLAYEIRVLLVLLHRHQAKILEHPQNENFLILLVHARLENYLQEFKPLK
ncbi:hypothetical protein DN390_13495 [Bacillus sp. SH7-1]|nr:hypothetical protein DN390_13495 [Bacillus sp. SH7-1]